MNTLNIESILLICMFTAVVVFYIVRAVVAVVRAKKAGIMRFIRPHETDFFVFGVIMLVVAASVAISELTLAARYDTYIADMERCGIPAIAEYYNTTVEGLYINPNKEDAEDAYLDAEIEKYTQKKRSAGANGLLYSGMFTLILLMTLTSGTFITKTGIQTLHSFSQDAFSVMLNGKWIILYNPKTERILFKVRANSENLQFFQSRELPL